MVQLLKVQLDSDLLACQDDLVFGPAHLGICPRIELERQVHGTLVATALLGDIAAHGGLALGVDGFVHHVTRRALLVGQLLILFR